MRRCGLVSQRPLTLWCITLIPAKSGINEINWVFKKCLLPNNWTHSCRLRAVFLVSSSGQTLSEGVRLKQWMQKGPWGVWSLPLSYLLETQAPPAVLLEVTEESRVVARKPWGFGQRTPGFSTSSEEGGQQSRWRRESHPVHFSPTSILISSGPPGQLSSVPSMVYGATMQDKCV